LVAIHVAFHQSIGFCSDHPGLGEHLAGLVADECLGSAGSNVDAEEMGHGEKYKLNRQDAKDAKERRYPRKDRRGRRERKE
jgi:hypothetical protein